MRPTCGWIAFSPKTNLPTIGRDVWQNATGHMTDTTVDSRNQPESIPADASDADLMRALAEGRMSALAELVRRHQDSIRAVAYRVSGIWDVADDVAQECFLRLFRSARSYKPTAAFRTWLYRIVVNLCLDKARSARPAALPEKLPARDGGPDAKLLQEEKRRAVQEAVAKLPERQRIALVLHRFEHLTHGQIAIATGWSESAIESLLTRAYEQLRQALADWSSE